MKGETLQVYCHACPRCIRVGNKNIYIHPYTDGETRQHTPADHPSRNSSTEYTFETVPLLGGSCAFLSTCAIEPPSGLSRW